MPNLTLACLDGGTTTSLVPTRHKHKQPKRALHLISSQRMGRQSRQAQPTPRHRQLEARPGALCKTRRHDRKTLYRAPRVRAQQSTLLIQLLDRKERESTVPMLGKRRAATKIPKRSTSSTAIRANRPPSSREKGNSMNGLNGRCVKGGRSAEVNIHLRMLSPHRLTTKERKRRPHSWNVGIRTRTSDGNTHNQELMRGRRIQAHDIPTAISGGPRLESADLQTHVPPFNCPRLNYKPLQNTNNAMMEPNNIM
jgi:hypothetical protein